ncbi:MAG: hypothetical protein IJC13_03540 [Clostridia bacterium]|nr:hypothetical protein [Clostridia bacterium]
MQIRLLNNTSYKKIKAVCDGKEYFIRQNESATVDTHESFILKIFTGDKNHLYFNLFDLLVDGWTDDEGIINNINYDAEFELVADGAEGIKVITVDDLEARDDHRQFIYNSVYLNSESVKVLNTEYLPTDTKKQKRRSWLYLVCLSSWIWLIIPLVVGAFVADSPLPLLAALFFFVVGAPSFKKASRLKWYFSEEHIIASLQEKEMEYRSNGGKPIPPEPNGIIEKGLDKVLNTVFKKKK